MPSIPLADNFLASSLLSLVLPVSLLIAIVLWYVLTVMRTSGSALSDVVEKLDTVVNPDPMQAEVPPEGAPPAPSPGRPVPPAGQP